MTERVKEKKYIISKEEIKQGRREKKKDKKNRKDKIGRKEE